MEVAGIPENHYSDYSVDLWEQISVVLSGTTRLEPTSTSHQNPHPFYSVFFSSLL